jgi:hypothetical protein
MIRLGIQGIEVLTTGQMSLPMALESCQLCRDIRQGRYTEPEVLEMATELEEKLKTVPSVLPPTVDRVKVNNFLVDTYTEWW